MGRAEAALEETPVRKKKGGGRNQIKVSKHLEIIHEPIFIHLTKR